MFNNQFTFIDLFAGIGGFRIALEKLGGKCIGFSEIDAQAINTYENNFNCSGEGYLGDITKISSLPKCDVIVGGVPCQSWSVAGKLKGFDDPRGKLWFDSIRLVKMAEPKVFIFENVKGLLDPRNKSCLDLLLKEFKKLKYKVSVKLLNAYDFGLPQNRDRVIIVGTRLDNNSSSKFEFPQPINKPHRLYKFFDNLNVDPDNLKTIKFSSKELFGGKVPFSRNRFQKPDELNDFFIMCDTRNGHTTVHSWDIIRTTKKEKEICFLHLRNRRKSKYGPKDGNALTLKDYQELQANITQDDIDGLISKKIFREVTEGQYEFANSKNSSGINGVYRVYFPESEIFSTLTATGTRDMIATRSIPRDTPEIFRKSFIKEIIKKKNYRSISPREAARLQGFPETFKIHENTKSAMKQFGNSVPVPVVCHVMESILLTGALSNASKINSQKKTINTTHLYSEL